MTIEEALEKLPEGEKNELRIEENTQEKIVDSSVVSALKTYPLAIHNMKKKNKDPFTPNIVSELAEFIRFDIRFDRGLCAHIGGIPRSEIPRVIGEQNPTLKSLLEETDLKESIPDPFFITDYSHYKIFPVSLERETGLEYYHFVNFEKSASTRFVIPNIQFMSLFIENGQDLRDYATITAELRNKPIFSATLKPFGNQYILDKEFEPFNSRDLKNFHDAYKDYKDREVSPMINQVKNLIKIINEPEYATEKLYRYLKQHNPQLIFHS